MKVIDPKQLKKMTAMQIRFHVAGQVAEAMTNLLAWTKIHDDAKGAFEIILSTIGGIDGPTTEIFGISPVKIYTAAGGTEIVKESIENGGANGKTND